MDNILCVTKKPPKIFIEANINAKKETIFDTILNGPEDSVPIAIIAPTIITAEIAFVTDIKGVCKDGVTDQTT